MADDPNALLRARLDRLAELEDLARQVALEDRACAECTIEFVAEARRIIEQAHLNQQLAQARVAVARAVTLRVMGDEAALLAELRIMDDRTRR